MLRGQGRAGAVHVSPLPQPVLTAWVGPRRECRQRWVHCASVSFVRSVLSEAAWLVHSLLSPEQGAYSKGAHSLKKGRQMVTNSV